MPIHPTKIMMVDDDPEFLSVEYDSLRQFGYDVIPVQNPAEAIPKALAEKPDLILLDLTLPRGDGYQLAADLRNHKELPHIPIIFLSGRDRWMDISYARRFGAVDYISKPVGRALLLQKIRRALAAIPGTFESEAKPPARREEPRTSKREQIR